MYFWFRWEGRVFKDKGNVFSLKKAHLRTWHCIPTFFVLARQKEIYSVAILWLPTFFYRRTSCLTSRCLASFYCFATSCVLYNFAYFNCPALMRSYQRRKRSFMMIVRSLHVCAWLIKYQKSPQVARKSLNMNPYCLGIDDNKREQQ